MNDSFETIRNFIIGLFVVVCFAGWLVWYWQYCQNNQSQIEYFGIDGMVRSQCIDGVKYLISSGQGQHSSTTTTPAIGADGKPVPCQ